METCSRHTNYLCYASTCPALCVTCARLILALASNRSYTGGSVVGARVGKGRPHSGSSSLVAVRNAPANYFSRAGGMVFAQKGAVICRNKTSYACWIHANSPTICPGPRINPPTHDGRTNDLRASSSAQLRHLFCADLVTCCCDGSVLSSIQ